MKKSIMLAFGLLFACALTFVIQNPKTVQAYQDVVMFGRAACSQVVSVSTTPVLVSSCLTQNRQEIRLADFASDTVYINYTLPASSTTAAASGVKLIQTTTNAMWFSLPISRDQKIYLTLAGNSGTGSVTSQEIGYY